MNSNQGNNQQQKQSGGYTVPSKSLHSTKRNSSPSRSQSRSRSRTKTGPHPFQNQAELQRVMSLFQ